MKILAAARLAADSAEDGDWSQPLNALGEGELVNATRRLTIMSQYRKLLAYDGTWIERQKLHRESHPKYQGQQKPRQLDNRIFNMQPSQLSQNLKDVYKDDYGDAAQSLNLFKNRMGKNLTSPDKDRLDKAKDELRKRYGKDDDSNKRKAAPAGPESNRKDGPAHDRKPVGTNPIGSRPTTRTV
jgi:hypothetical protein